MEMTDIVNILMNSMTGITMASSVAGALMGSRRRIGAAKGLLIGLFLPVIGVTIVATSRKTVLKKEKKTDENDRTISEEAHKNAGEQFNKDNPVIRPERQHEGRWNEGKCIHSEGQKRKMV